MRKEGVHLLRRVRGGMAQYLEDDLVHGGSGIYGPLHGRERLRGPGAPTVAWGVGQEDCGSVVPCGLQVAPDALAHLHDSLDGRHPWDGSPLDIERDVFLPSSERMHTAPRTAPLPHQTQATSLFQLGTSPGHCLSLHTRTEAGKGYSAVLERLGTAPAARTLNPEPKTLNPGLAGGLRAVFRAVLVPYVE